MTEIRLYVDEDAAQQAVVSGLRTYGLDVQTVLDLHAEALSDEEQLEFATAAGRTIYTLNVADFAKLHSEWLAINKAVRRYYRDSPSTALDRREDTPNR